VNALFIVALLVAQPEGPATVSGLQVGEAVPSFEPVHVAGPDRGTQACPICTYGARTMILAVARDGADVARLAGEIERLVATYVARDLKGFVLVVGSTPDKLRRLAREAAISRAALCYPEPGHEDKDLRRKLRINPAAVNTVIVYRRFRVTSNFVNVEARDFAAVEAAVKKTLD
jgi:protocatechuate 3,4-dioxygenase beta subunit